MFFEWNEDKNLLIKQQRGVGFEEVVLAFENDNVLDIIEHHNSEKYPNQNLFVIDLNGYVHYVPFVKDADKYFLKNIIPSRKLHNLYKKGGQHGLQ